EVATDVVDDDLCPLARQRERDTAADAPARSGDHRHFAREQRAHRTVLRAAALTRPARECQLKGRISAAPGALVGVIAVGKDCLQDRLIFLIGAPRSGTTLLARMLGAHSTIYGRAEPHLITPIAHLGYYANVQKAPYDPFNLEQAVREFVADLPRGEADYLDALRAYTDTMYERMLSTAPGKRFFLDKTPAYALVLPFL